MLVRALYPFRSTSPNELSIHATQRLALIEGGYNSESGACWGDCGWVRVATLDGLREGYVPAGYVVLDKDDDVARQLRLNAQREAEQIELLRAQGQREAQAAEAAAKVRTAKRSASRRNATAAKAEAAAEAAESAQAEASRGGASQAAGATDGYDSSSACSHGSTHLEAAAAKLTKKELKELCARHGISTSSRIERTDLVALAAPHLLPPLDPTPAPTPAPAPAPAPVFTPCLAVPSRAAAQPCDRPAQLPMAAARPVFEKDSAQEAHLRETRLQAEAYFAARRTAEDNPGTSAADSGAEHGPSKRHKAAASPLPEVPERTADAVRL